MKQETIEQIITIIPAVGWREVWANEKAGGTLEPIIVPCAYFALMRETILMPGCRYHYNRASDDQDIEEVVEYVEFHSEADGAFEDPRECSNFYKFLGPGEEWKGEEDQKAMEAHFAERERVRKLMLEAAARKKAEGPPQEKKGGEGTPPDGPLGYAGGHTGP